jgi:NosR/NirI family nitrous oxide reductase transcriptional regulator
LSPEQTPPRLSQRDKRRRLERILAVSALALIGLVWILGSVRAEADKLASVQDSMPQADHFERTEDDVYAAWADNDEQELLGYVAIGSANGYGGPLELAVAVNLDGEIIGFSVVDHKETPSWFDRVTDRDFLGDLIGKSYADSFTVGDDVDGVTGATITSRALAEAALNGSQAAARVLGFEVTASASPDLQFGIPEIAVLGLFIVGYIGHQRGFKYKKQVRWGSMFAGLIVLGFIYNIPITVAYFVKLVLGYWPQWQTHLYWYFLLGGLLFVVTADNKNPYCEWFCPFGAAQECMGLIGGAKIYSMRQHRNWLAWVQRGLALIAILLGVFFRNPGLASFEIFGVLFDLFGSSLQIAVLALVLIVALFVKRPWCTYLCPIHPIVDFVRIIRQWVNELWQKVDLRTKPA